MFIELTVVKRTVTTSPVKGAKPTEAISEYRITFNPDQIVAMEEIDHPEVGRVTMAAFSNGANFPIRETPTEIEALVAEYTKLRRLF